MILMSKVWLLGEAGFPETTERTGSMHDACRARVIPACCKRFARIRFAAFPSLYHLWNLKRDGTVSPARKRKKENKSSNLNFLDEFSNMMISTF